MAFQFVEIGQIFKLESIKQFKQILINLQATLIARIIFKLNKIMRRISLNANSKNRIGIILILSPVRARINFQRIIFIHYFYLQSML